MQKSAGMMRVLLDSLLRYSRVTTKPAPFEKTDLKESVEAALSNLEVNIKEKDALVEVCELPVIEVDPVQMIQLFQNIAANALKFCSEEHSPRVKFYSLPPESDNGDENKMHRICVEDNGIGFDERYVDKMFCPFQRLHGKIKYQGVHGGKITARSAVDKGTTFIITLPERRQD
jgi:light-regulated signal transduction histidine kinase (bacteriophytochrome)